MLPTVVQVPDILFDHRRIFLEVKGVNELENAQRAAVVLGKIMKNQLMSQSASDSPNAMPIIIPGQFGDNGG